MGRIRWVFVASLIMMLVALSVLVGCAAAEQPAAPPAAEKEEAAAPVEEEMAEEEEAAAPAEEKILYIGGTMALTGAYAEDTAALLAGYEDYVKYINETKQMAPWRDETFPDDVTLELLWRDDALEPPKALSIYEELKGMKMLVFRVSGTPQAMALKDVLNEERIGATSMASGAYLLSPPQTVFTQYPLYTDSLAAIADWFLENWTEDRAPRVAYLTNDTFGRSVLIPEMDAYLTEAGYELVGTQLVPMVPTAPPTTQLLWLKENGVDLALGAMINPGSQPTIKEAVRLGMGPHLDYKITFGLALPSHLQIFVPAMGELGDGLVVAGGYPSWDDPSPGMEFAHELQDKYRSDDRVPNIMYVHGLVEAMIQVEALGLAMQEVPFEELEPVDVLEYGFYRIKDLDTGGITSSPLTYGPADIEGVDQVRVDQVQGGQIVHLGTWPAHGIYKHE